MAGKVRRVESLLLVTLRCPEPGEYVRVDGERYRVERVVRFTGTVARLLIAPAD